MKALIILLIPIMAYSQEKPYIRAGMDLQVYSDMIIMPTVSIGFTDSTSNFGFDYRLSYGFGWYGPNQITMMTGLQYQYKHSTYILYPFWFKKDIGLGYITPSSFCYRYSVKGFCIEPSINYWNNKVYGGLRFCKWINLEVK